MITERDLYLLLLIVGAIFAYHVLAVPKGAPSLFMARIGYDTTGEAVAFNADPYAGYPAVPYTWLNPGR